MQDRPAPTDVAGVPPTSVRLPPELRDRLAKSAAENSRTLSAEIVRRLWESAVPQPDVVATDAAGKVRYVLEAKSTGPVTAQTLSERRLLALYAQLSPEQQLALLTLLKA